MEDGTVDYPGSVIGTYFIEFLNASGYNATAILRRMKLKDWVNIPGANTAFIRNNIAINGSYTATITLEACLLKNFGNLFFGSTAKAPIHLNLLNNTATNGAYQFLYNDSVVDSRSEVQITGNIFNADNTFYTPLYFGNLAPDCSNGRCGPPANWLVKGNVLYKAGDYPDTNNLNRIADNSAYGNFPDETNHFINPDFTDPDNDDYTPRNGLMTGKGYSANLPSVDINGNAWIGVADVGAFKNPSPASPTMLDSNTLIVIGDSIPAGASYRLAQDQALGWLPDWTIYGAGSSCNTTAGANCSSWGGSLGATHKWLIDRAVEYWGVPSYIAILTYNNSLGPRGNSPTNLTTTQAADDVLTMAKKVQAWGATPIILGMMPSWHATREGQLTTAQDFNSKLNTMCVANGYICEFPLDRMIFNSNYANAYNGTPPGYYTAETLVSNVHPYDPEGRRLINSTLEDILLERIAYYITQNGTSIVGSEYGPATYRYPLSMDGLNGSSIYPNKDIIISGKEVNTYYNLTLDSGIANLSGDGCSTVGSDFICKSNDDGEVIFQHTSTYAQHTFDITEGDNTPPYRSEGSPSGEQDSGTTQITISLTTEESATCKYSATSNTAYDSMEGSFTNEGGTEHSTASISGLTDGTSYIYYVRCEDATGNANTIDYEISFSIAEETADTDISNDIDNDISTDTDHKNLEITNVEATSTANSITIEWETNNLADSKVFYGTNKDLGKEKEETTNEEEHKVTISNLDSDTIYYYKVKSRDRENDEDTSEIHSVKTEEEEQNDSSVETQDFASLPSGENGSENNNNNNSNPAEELKNQIQEQAQSTKQSIDNFFTAQINKIKNKFILSEIKLRIIDKNNNPIPNLLATIHSEPQTSTTNQEGIITFKDIEAGKHTIKFAYQNETYEKRIAIEEPKDGINTIQAQITDIKAEHEKLPMWVFGTFAFLILVIIWLAVKARRRKNIV